jgi:hypothetical protein
VPAQLAQQLNQRRVRDRRLAELYTAADRGKHPVLPGPCAQLPDQPGLADTRIASEQHDPRPASLGRAGRIVRSLQLIGTSDQRRAGHPPGHTASMRSDPGSAH